MNIAGREIGPGEPPYIIAEIGVNHDGDPARAVELVDRAKEAGADAIKLQFFRAELLCSKAVRPARYQESAGENDPLAMLRGLELSIDNMVAVVERAQTLDIHPILSVFTRELVEEAERLDWAAYKTASTDIINRPLLESLKQTGRPIIMSTGAATGEEVARAAAWMGDYPHAFLHCVSAYPTPFDRADLWGRRGLESITPHGLGYSDHTAELDTGAYAVASGACILEKHLTHDRGASGPDHACSLDPPGFAEYVRLAHRAYTMCQVSDVSFPGKRVQDIEEDVRSVSRQSLISTRDLPIGYILERADLTVKRPGSGLEPWQMENTIGRRLARAVAADMPLQEDDLSP